MSAELERLRESQAALVAELSIRDVEVASARETLTKQEGDIARTRQSWQQATELVSGLRRAIADADVAANGSRMAGATQAAALHQQIAEREQRIARLEVEVADAIASMSATQAKLDEAMHEALTKQTAIGQLSEVIAARERALQDARSQLAHAEVLAATELRDLRDRLAARSDELSVLSLQTSGRVAELVAASVSQGETVARLSNDLGAVRTELIREASSHADARRKIEAGEALALRLRSELEVVKVLAGQRSEEAERLKEQVWSLERDLSASRQLNAQLDDRVSELDADLARAEAARLAAATEAVRLEARVENDAAALQALREDLESARSVLQQISLVPDTISTSPPLSAPLQPHALDPNQIVLQRAEYENELAGLRLELAARDEARWERERALDAFRAQALTGESILADARLGIAMRDAVVSRLADDLMLRDNDVLALDSRIKALVRENDLGSTAIGKLDRRLGAISGSLSYRWGLAGAAIARTWRRAIRRIRRGRANPLFDAGWYLDKNPDVRWSGVDPFEHYRRHGHTEGRTPNRVFDPLWYLAVNPDVKASGVEPLEHYAKSGAAEGRNPSPNFDMDAYLRRHPEAKAGGQHPLLHYLKTEPVTEPYPTSGPSVLVVAWHCPTRAHAGGLRILDLYDYLRRMAPNARLDLFTVRKPSIDWAYDDLDKIFDNVHFTDSNDLSLSALNSLRSDRTVYDVVDFQFLESGHDVEAYRSIGRKLIFTPMELLSRAFHIERQSPGRLSTVQRVSEQTDVVRRELALCRAVDEVVCVSGPDADFLRSITDLTSVVGLETGVSELEFAGIEAASEASRVSKVAVFVAYFGSPTNVEALDWYLQDVHPKVKAAVPDYRLDVVGRGDLSRYADLADPALNLVGEVATVGPSIARAALGISPALGGAGFRGKINQYAVLGVATVASPIAAEGFAYRDGIDILVGRDADTFAAHCVRLLTDPDFNRDLAESAKRTCAAHYSWAAREGAIRSIYGVRRQRTPGAPVVTAIVPSYNHGRYIEERILSIVDQTYPNIDLVVIDDKSPDDSDARIRRLRDRFGFTYIRREQNSGTPFAAWAYAAENAVGEFVWICESDDFATADFASTGVDRLCQDRDAVLYYCNSHVVDEGSRIIGSTADYFRDIWQESRWERGFTADGMSELSDYQVRGMIVPNMSSALIRTDAFRTAWRADLKKFRLTGDWLFIGRVLTGGRAIFDAQLLSHFRKHAVTARERVKSAQSQAEFVVTKYRLHKLAKKRTRDLAVTLKADATRFIYEPASGRDVVAAMMKISRLDTMRIGVALGWSMLFHRQYWSKFRARLSDIRRAGLDPN